MKMIGCYLTGILPRPEKLVEATRAYDRGRLDEAKLEKAFRDASLKAVNAQLSAGLSVVTDGMLRWQDLLRPFSENLDGVKTGSLARWFNNNTFFRKPVIIGDIERKRSIVKSMTFTSFLPRNVPWKAVLPAPYTFVQLSENQFYKTKEEFMFRYAEILREEIKDLAEMGFEYVQLSDPSLVHHPNAVSVSKEELDTTRKALEIAVKGIRIKTCLHTFFGDFSQILPDALDFPVDQLGIDLYETNFKKLKGQNLEKGVALGLVDARSSLIENPDELVKVSREILNSVYSSKIGDVFVCPNCDLEFLPWKIAEKKMRVIGSVANLLREEFHE